MRVLTDTSVVTRIRDADSPRQELCVEAIRRLVARGDTPCVCAQVYIEYWAVATRPRDVNGLGLEPAQAEADLRDCDEIFTMLPEPPDLVTVWRDLVARYGVRGRLSHDARLVALMVAHGVTPILTLNPGDFRRYREITVLTPEEL